jgi:hypothetical protein
LGEKQMSLNGTCDVHDWSWDPADDYGCPVCKGEIDMIDALIQILKNKKKKIKNNEKL